MIGGKVAEEEEEGANKGYDPQQIVGYCARVLWSRIMQSVYADR